MDKYVIAPPSGSTNNSVGASDRPWHEGHFDSVKLNGGDVGEYLAESTGYGIVSGCEPSISGLTVTVGAGVLHLADGTRKEIAQTNITLDSADSTNPRIDLVYINADGEVAKVTGTASATPSAPVLPSNGISVCNVAIAAEATTIVMTVVATKKKEFMIYDNVTAMKMDDNLKPGTKVKVIGKNRANDGYVRDFIICDRAVERTGIVLNNTRYIAHEITDTRRIDASAFRDCWHIEKPSFATLMGLQGTIPEEMPSVHTVRISLNWAYIETGGDGRYYFDAETGYTPNLYIENAIKENKRVIVYFEASKDNETFNSVYPTAAYKFVGADTAEIEAYGRFVAAAAKRFAGMGITWEMLNEPDANTPVMELLKVFSEAILENDKSGIRIAPSYPLIDNQSLFITDNCISNLIDRGMMSYIDGISYHNYKESYPESDSSVSGYNGLRRCLAIKGYSGVPIYCTEAGYSLYNTFESSGTSLTEKQQADYLVRSFLYDAVCGVHVRIWHQGKNGAQENYSDHTSGIYQENNFGLFRYNNERKPTFYAYRLLSNIMGNATFEKNVFIYYSNIKAYLFRQDGNRYVLAFFSTTNNVETNFTIRISGNITSTNPATLVEMNVTTGTITSTDFSTKEITLTAKNTPAYLLVNEVYDIFTYYTITSFESGFTGNVTFVTNGKEVWLNGSITYTSDFPYGTLVFRVPGKLMPATNLLDFHAMSGSPGDPVTKDAICRIQGNDSGGDFTVITYNNGKIVRFHNISYRLR